MQGCRWFTVKGALQYCTLRFWSVVSRGRLEVGAVHIFRHAQCTVRSAHPRGWVDGIWKCQNLHSNFAKCFSRNSDEGTSQMHDCKSSKFSELCHSQLAMVLTRVKCGKVCFTHVVCVIYFVHHTMCCIFISYTMHTCILFRFQCWSGSMCTVNTL